MKLLFDESLSPKLVLLLNHLFRNSASALRNRLARTGDRNILQYAVDNEFVLTSTDAHFERLSRRIPGSKVVILSSCNYPTDVAAEVLRRNAIRIAALPESPGRLIVLDQ